MLAKPNRLRRHADFQRVYKSSRKQFSKQMSFFFTLSPKLAAPRVGLTVGKVLGKAVDRNRIKRRLRAAIRKHLALLRSPVEVILHPRRTVLELDFDLLDREIAQVFRTIQKMAGRQDPPS